MPRNRKFQKTSNWNKNTQSKYRIGRRKDGVSALKMSTKSLLAVLANEDKAKYHKNAAYALGFRGNLAQ